MKRYGKVRICSGCKELCHTKDMIFANLFVYTETSTEHLSTIGWCKDCYDKYGWFVE